MVKEFALPQASRRSLVSSVIEAIRAQVETGAWPIGERIPKEAELAEKLQVSRNTVREAVSVLSHANVLEVRQGDGTYVRSNIDPAEIMRRVSRAGSLAHFEIRAILEQGPARLAAMRRTEAEVKELTRLFEERGDAPAKEDLATFAERDIAFHFGIVRASHNEALEELFRYFAASAIANTHALLNELEHLGQGADKAMHEAILRAIEAGLPDQAAEAVQTLMKSITTSVAELPNR
ncbi:FadR/GntR family transcriptional regulator [Acidocella sp.]|jgi:DNA-binding FadR family transcriptional regulator|uniref:FadR/GntR family transcriptional regulator n=1 Tax=Acidocella sp. TaxID=50710 RepID=UPI002F3F738A